MGPIGVGEKPKGREAYQEGADQIPQTRPCIPHSQSCERCQSEQGRGEAERENFREGGELRSGLAAFAPAEQQAADKTLDEEADEGCNGPEPGDLAQGPVRYDEAENEGDDKDGQDNRRDVDEG